MAENSSIDGLRYYHQDHLGSSVAITDRNGALIYRANYTPFGSDAYSNGNAMIKYKFTGQEKDDIGLYYYGARYYDPELGRFISPDINLDGLNRYTYCNNNPVIYVDPTGEFWIVISAIIGAYAGHLAAESKGISFNSGWEYWGYVITGGAIGVLSAGIGQWAAGLLPAGTSTALTMAVGGMAGGFTSGFMNSWAFGGDGTELFRGDLGQAFKTGLYCAFLGAAIGGSVGYIIDKNPVIFDKIWNIKIYTISGKSGPVDITTGFILESICGLQPDDITLFGYDLDVLVNEVLYPVIQKGISYINYNACTLINVAIMNNSFSFEYDSSNKTNISLDFLSNILWDKKTKERFTNKYLPLKDTISLAF